VIAHLWAWQQRSIAWLEAARLDREPKFPAWPVGADPDPENDLEFVNAWLYETYHEQPWSRVQRDWRAGILRFLELAEAISENDLLNPERYAWMEGQPLAVMLMSSYEHYHEEHLEPLLAWLRQQGTLRSTE
jgi:hypothetical protein